MQRGLWEFDDDDPARNGQPRSQHRAESQWQSTFRTSDGRWIMHREMRTDDGGVIGISTDITDLKIRQDEAEQANETARLLVSDLERTLDSLRMGVVLLDASLTIQVVNKEFYDIWKIGPGGRLGWQHLPDADGCQPPQRHLRRGGRPLGRHMSPRASPKSGPATSRRASSPAPTAAR